MRSCSVCATRRKPTPKALEKLFLHYQQVVHLELVRINKDSVPAIPTELGRGQ